MGANVQKQQPKRYVPQDPGVPNPPNSTKNKPTIQTGAAVQVHIEQPVLTLKSRNGGGNTVMEAPVILPGSLKRNTLEEALDDENSSPEDVILDDMFVFSDFTIDTSILAETVTPFGKRKQKKIAHGTIKLDSFAGGGVAIASLTIPLIIKSKLIHNVANASKKNPGVKFDFSDFQVILTEDELNEEIIRKSGAMFGNIEVKELLEARNNKVSRILNYSITTLLGRSSRIKCLRLTPDEKRLVACSHDDQILVMYDLTTCKPVLQFQGHEDTVMSICFSPDGKFLCSSSRDETIIMWDVSTAKQVHVMQHSSMVITCDYSRDGQHIVSGCQDKVCRVWEARSGKELLSFNDHQGLIICICIAPDSRLVASASADRTLMLWELRTGRRRQILRGHSGVVLSCAFSPDNLRVVSNDEKNIKIWNARDGKLLQTLGMEERVPSRSSALPIPHLTNIANRVEMKYILSAYSPGSHIVTAVNNKVVQLLDPNTGGETLSLFLKASVYSCCCGNINTIALGDANGNIYIVKLVLENDHLALPPSAMRHLAGERRSED